MCEPMQELHRTARKVASTDTLVLLTGETGVGKEVFARIIHDASPRSSKPFVPFNCSAVPREMLESQLFGHRRGAFTGADHESSGVIRAAAGGTLFLDEIGEITPDLQPKLLRFIELGETSPARRAATDEGRRARGGGDEPAPRRARARRPVP